MADGAFLYTDVDAFTNTVWAAALQVAQIQNVLASTVTVFSDQQGLAPRSVTEWAQGTVFRQIAETDDLTPTHFDRTLLSTLTPYTYGDQHVISYQRLRTELEDAKAQAAKDLGYMAGKTIEKHLISEFANLTGGTIGAAGTVITWKYLFAARAQFEASGISGPYTVVLHPYQLFQLQSSVSVSGLTLNAVPAPADLQTPFQIFTVGDMTIISTPNITVDNNNDATGAMYTREALALDIREAFHVSPQDDVSFRHLELNAWMTYARGVWRPTYGKILIFDAATPTGA